MKMKMEMKIRDLRGNSSSWILDCGLALAFCLPIFFDGFVFSPIDLLSGDRP